MRRMTRRNVEEGRQRHNRTSEEETGFNRKKWRERWREWCTLFSRQQYLGPQVLGARVQHEGVGEHHVARASVHLDLRPLLRPARLARAVRELAALDAGGPARPEQLGHLGVNQVGKVESTFMSSGNAR